MWLTRFAIERRVTIAMVIVALLVLGAASYLDMPWEQYPDVEFPFIFVSVPYPGAGPEEVEEAVVRPLEEQVSIISGVEEVTGTCQENLGSVSLQFAFGTNIDAAASDVRDAIDRARIQFPEDVLTPQLVKLDIGALPVMTVGFTGNRSPRDLFDLLDDTARPRLGQIPGVAAVSVTGGVEREIQIRVDKERLDAVGMNLGSLSRYLAASNLRLPAGSLREGLRDYNLRVLGEFESLDEIRRLRVPTPRGGLVPLASLAEVLDTSAEAATVSRINQTSAVTISILKQSGANTVAVCDRARREIERMVGTEDQPGQLPPDVQATIAYDGADEVRESIFAVAEAIFLGTLLSSLIVLLFLHNLRATVIIFLCIPTSLIAGLVPLGLGLGFTINSMVLLAFTVAVGILVDDAIVILENIQRHLDVGEQPAAAAFNGRTEIGAAAIAISLVGVVVFVPLALMGGIIGQWFYPFGISVAAVVLLSLFISFTMVPSLAAWWFRRIEKGLHRARDPLNRAFQSFYVGWDRGFAAIVRVYRRLLEPAIRHPYLTVVIFYGALVLVAVLLVPQLGGGFFPDTDESQISIQIESAPGTRLEYTDSLLALIEARLADEQRYPEIKDVSSTAGTLAAGAVMGGGESGGQYGNLFLALHKRPERVRAGQRSDAELVLQLREDLADLPGALVRVFAQSGMGGGGGADLDLNLLSNDLDALNAAAQQISRQMEQIPGLLYVDTSSKPGRPEVRIVLDRERLASYGLTVAEVAMDLRAGFTGATDTKYREDGDEYDLRVEFSAEDQSSVDMIGEAVVAISRSGETVRVRDIARLELAAGPSLIERINRQRAVRVSAYLDPEVTNLNEARAAVEQLVEQADLGAVTWQWGGQVEWFIDSFLRMLRALALTIILVYVLIAALYNSLLDPLNIMLNLPVALLGALIGLWLFGMDLTIISMLGIVMLMGLVAKSSILLVDYTKTLRARGVARFDALLESGTTRLKPILMATLTTIMALVPTAVAVSEGSEFRAPLAVAVIFGLALGTLVSLVLVPATYIIWDNISDAFSALGGRLFSGERRPRPAPQAESSEQGGE